VWFGGRLAMALAGGAAGLIAAVWLATMPIALFESIQPMSDVPVTAAWLACWWWIAKTSELPQLPPTTVNSLAETAKKGTVPFLAVFAGIAVSAGLAAALAVLIRPNLAPLAAILVLWRFWTQSFRAVIPMIVGALPGCLFIAWLNNKLYGSPLASGYGSLSVLFSLSFVATNVERYGRWLVQSQTPLAVIGIVALLWPVKSIWLTPERQYAARLLGAIVVVVWALYVIYIPFEAWWFLRFLLPAWPAMCLGSAALLVRMAQSGRLSLRIMACAMRATSIRSRGGARPSRKRSMIMNSMISGGRAA
jgi:hypothetical protein